jgi:hypothetical protein
MNHKAYRLDQQALEGISSAKICEPDPISKCSKFERMKAHLRPYTAKNPKEVSDEEKKVSLVLFCFIDAFSSSISFRLCP